MEILQSCTQPSICAAVYSWPNELSILHLESPLSWWRHQMETFSALLFFVLVIHWSPVNSPHRGQWRGALMFSLICAWTNKWVNNRDAGGLRRHNSHYDVTVMYFQGSRGSPGSPGSPGPRGDDGSENGSQGFTGSTGPRGGTGSTGPQGVRGPPGRDWRPPLSPTGGPGPNDIGNVAARNMECASQEVLGKILPACVIRVTTVRTRSSKTIA